MPPAATGTEAARSAAVRRPPPARVLHWQHLPDCSSLAEFRNVSPGMDGEEFITSGEIRVGDAPIRDVVVCQSEVCATIADGTMLLPGTTLRFALSMRRRGLGRLMLQCSSPEP